MADKKQSYKVAFVEVKSTDPKSAVKEWESALEKFLADGWEFVGTAGPCGVHGHPVVLRSTK